MTDRKDDMVMMVAIVNLDRSHNIRQDLGDIDELTESIRQVGVLTPITITAADPVEVEGVEAPPLVTPWIVVAGHRRVAAAETAGMSRIPALVVDFESVEYRLVATLVENLIRHDLDPVDEAHGFRRLIDAGWSQDQIAVRVTRSKAHISKRLRLLALPPEVAVKVRDGSVTLDHAYQLARLVDEVTPKRLAKLADQPVQVTETLMREKDAQATLEAKLVEVRETGARAEIVEDLYSRDSKARQLSSVPLEIPEVEATALEAHQSEPCRFIGVWMGYSNDIHVYEMCENPDRHQPDGESSLKVPDYPALRAEQDEDRRVEREAEQAKKAAVEANVIARLLAADPQAVLEAVIRAVAVDDLTPAIDETLIPIPEDVEGDGYHQHRYPVEAIMAASVERLVVAMALQKLNLYQVEWSRRYSQEVAAMFDGLAELIGLDDYGPPPAEEEEETDE